MPVSEVELDQIVQELKIALRKVPDDVTASFSMFQDLKAFVDGERGFWASFHEDRLGQVHRVFSSAATKLNAATQGDQNEAKRAIANAVAESRATRTCTTRLCSAVS